MSDKINTLSYEQERSGGATKFNYTYKSKVDGETKNQYISVIKERLYLPGYQVQGDGDNKSFTFPNDEMWAAFSANHKDKTSVESNEQKPDLDIELANSLMAAMNPDVVAFDDKAQKFYVRRDADFSAVSDARLGISGGDKLIEHTTKRLQADQAAGRISELTITDTTLKNFSTELSEGASHIVHKDESGKEWDRKFINNRQYVTTPAGQKDRDVLGPISNESDSMVKYDGFAMMYYIPYDKTFDEKAEFKTSHPELNVISGDRCAEFAVKVATERDNVELITNERMTQAGYTAFKEGYIAEKDAEAKEVQSAKDIASQEQSANNVPDPEIEKDFARAEEGPTIGR